VIASVKAFVPKRARQLLRATYGKGRARSQDCDAPHALMKLPGFRFCPPISVGLTAVLLALPAVAATLHVWQESPSPAPPYADWATAAHVIQDAVDAAQAGDTVLVTNGVYSSGGRPVPGSSLTNRVMVTQAITLLSVNGPAETLIEGAPDPAGWRAEGDGAIRCAYLGGSAVLGGFTLTNGHTRTWLGGNEATGPDTEGGGVWCQADVVVTNCVLVGCTANRSGGGVFGGRLEDCTLTANAANGGGGGGASASNLRQCVLSENSAGYGGGGATNSVLQDCTLINNQASERGGGAARCVLRDCLLANNRTSGKGGGASDSSLEACMLANNYAYSSGGGVQGGTLRNCRLDGNSSGEGGGACLSELHNCALTRNSVQYQGGGSSASTLYKTVR